MGFFIHLYAQNSKYVRISTFWETQVKEKIFSTLFESFVFKAFQLLLSRHLSSYLKVSQSLIVSKCKNTALLVDKDHCCHH